MEKAQPRKRKRVNQDNEIRKRKRSNQASTHERNNRPTKNWKHVSPRITFFTLPRELRQAILLLTRDKPDFPSIRDDDGFPDSWAAAIRRAEFTMYMVGNTLWASTLNSVHLNLFDDVRYVAGQWQNEGELLRKKWNEEDELLFGKLKI
jgi:hypothetical protein